MTEFSKEKRLGKQVKYEGILFEGFENINRMQMASKTNLIMESSPKLNVNSAKNSYEKLKIQSVPASTAAPRHLNGNEATGLSSSVS